MKNIVFLFMSIYINCFYLYWNRFIQFLIKIYKPTKRNIDISKLKKSFIKIVPDFNDDFQHDTSEFMDYLLNTLDDGLKKYKVFVNVLIISYYKLYILYVIG